METEVFAQKNFKSNTNTDISVDVSVNKEAKRLEHGRSDRRHYG